MSDFTIFRTDLYPLSKLGPISVNVGPAHLYPLAGIA